MKKNKLALILIVVLVIGVVFVTNDFFGLLGEQEVAQEQEIEEQVDEEEVISIRAAGGDEDSVERYEELNPNVEIELVDLPPDVDDMFSMFQQVFEDESSDFDVVQMDVIWAGDLGEHFVDLYEYGAEDVVDDYFDSIIENNTIDGELVAIPWFMDTGVLYYREDLLEEYGYDVPETWDELEMIAREIQEAEREAGNEMEGFVWQGDTYESLTTNALEWIYSHNGGSIIEADGTVSINNPNAINALNRAGDWVGDITPEDVTSMNEPISLDEFREGNAVFMRNWPYAYAESQDEEESDIVGNVGIAPLPAGPGGESAATVGGWHLGVSKYSEHPEVAADLALFMASYDEQKFRAIEHTYNPTIPELYEDEDVLEEVPFMADLVDVFENAVARPSTATAPYYNEVSREFYTEVYEVLLGNKDGREVVEYLEEIYEEMGVGEATDEERFEEETEEPEEEPEPEPEEEPEPEPEEEPEPEPETELEEGVDYYYYTVQSGDTLRRIESETGVNFLEIYELNEEKLEDVDIIYPDQAIKIPKN